jgi:hypothetical protein
MERTTTPCGASHRRPRPSRCGGPTEGKAPRDGFKTEAKIAYDASNLYVYVRAYDPHPDSIITLLERRDTYTASDMIWIFVDSYRDRRTGYEFGVNAAGVKMDMAIYDDGNEDSAWDAVLGRRDEDRFARLDCGVPAAPLADAVQLRTSRTSSVFSSTANILSLQ